MMGLASPGSLDGKESFCNGKDLGFVPVLGRSPGGGHGNPLRYSCLENPHGQRSLAGYSPWGHQESAMTEPHTRTRTHTNTRKDGVVWNLSRKYRTPVHWPLQIQSFVLSTHFIKQLLRPRHCSRPCQYSKE